MPITIRVLEDRCKPCLLCVRECVAGAFREVDGRPAMVAPELCNRCSHCMAVCPRGAIVHEALDLNQIRRTDRDLLDPGIFAEIVHSRRSIRQFRQKEVPAEIIQSILDLASHSPTASNRQNVGYTVITDKRLLQAISESVFGVGRWIHARTRKGIGRYIYRVFTMVSPENGLDRYLSPMQYYIAETAKGRNYVLHNAPALILVHAPAKGPFHSENCNIAAANIMNAAHARGLGTCYIGFLCLALRFSRTLRRLVQVPRARKVYACIIMGYPAYRHAYTASRKKPVIQWLQGKERMNQAGS